MKCCNVHDERSTLPCIRWSRLRVVVVALFCCALFLFNTLPAAAQSDADSADLTTKTLEELMELKVATVYGASRFEQKVTDAPASVTIITADEIAKYGYRSLADILRSVRGFFVTNDRNYSFLGVRGFNRPGDYNTRVLLLVDGHRINDNIYDQAPVGMDFPLDVDLIDRIEVIRGPSSSLYGANAFFGVISIYTVSGDLLDGLEISSSAASRETYTGRISYGDTFWNGLETVVSGSVFTGGGEDRLFYKEFATPATNNGVAVNADGEKAYSLFGKLGWRDLTLTGVYSSRDKHIPTASFGTVFNDRRAKTTDDHGYLDLNYSHTFGNDLSATGRLFYDRYYYHGHYPYDLSDAGFGGIAVNKDTALGEWWGAEAQLTRTFHARHKLTVGAEFRDNISQEQKNYYTDRTLPPSLLTPILDDDRSSRVWALFFQDEFHLLDNLILNAGVRFDHYDTFGGTFNPRAALIYRPVDTAAIKLLYGEAFRAPNAYELYYNDGGVSVKSNPYLEPEKIRTYEVVYEQYLGEHLRSSVSGFYYRINSLISQQLDPLDGLLVFRNVDKVDAKGAEVEVEGSWSNGLQAKASCTYQDATDLGTGEGLTNSPHVLAKGNLIVPLLRDKLFASPELQYTSSRKTLSGGSTGSFVVANLTLFGKNLLKGLELSGSIYNLFDKKYGDPGGAEHRQDVIRQDGRTFRLKLTYSF